MKGKHLFFFDLVLCNIIKGNNGCTWPFWIKKAGLYCEPGHGKVKVFSLLNEGTHETTEKIKESEKELKESLKKVVEGGLELLKSPTFLPCKIIRILEKCK